MVKTLINNSDMIMEEQLLLESRVLLLPPTARDAELSRAILTEAGLACMVCPDLKALCREIDQGAGCLLLAESELQGTGLQQLVETLQQQPPWSDPPLIVLSRGGADDSPHLLDITQTLINVTLLEVPARISTLLSTLRTALRARARQYQMRNQILAQQKVEEALRETETRFRLATSVTHVMVYENDLLSSRTHANEGLEQLLGFRPDESDPTPAWWFSRIHPDDRFGPEQEKEILERQDIYRVEYRIRHKDGHYLHVVDTGRVFRDETGRPVRTVGSVTDITERKQAEEALQAAVAQLTQANAQLEEADRRKDEFLAMLAHELRNPLAPIRNAAQVLHFIAPEEPSLQRQRDIIDRQVMHMARLLDDLLDVSRITRGNVNLKRQPATVAEILCRAVESAAPLIASHRHTLTFSPPPEDLQVLGDFDRLLQVVGNLLSNAAKYTEEGGIIWLEAHPEGKEVIIRVRDTGVGIAREMLPKIFDVFTQVERSLDRSQGGLGLGLTLVRSLVQMHGGSVEATSPGLGQGSEFLVRLPLLPTTPAAAPHQQEKPPPLAEAPPRRILVVDDVVDTADSLAELLGLLGHDTRTATDGPSAIATAHAFHPEVILLDIGLPGDNGYEVARQMRRDPELADVYLVALTGYGQEEDRKMAEQAGFDHHFTKPVDIEALQTLLARPLKE